MEETLYTDLIAKYLSGNIAEAEREMLWTWVEADAEHRHFFDQMVQLWGMSDDYEEASYPTDTGEAWSKLESRLFGGTAGFSVEPHQPSNKIVRLSIKRAWMAAAAVILLAISVSIWLYTRSIPQDHLVVYQTGAQERRMIELPDQSKVWLNENTRLSFHTDFTQRLVELEGEAFFDVEHLDGKQFKILSDGAETTVWGTSFNVRAYPSETKIEVTVETGKVSLKDQHKTDQGVLLEKGETGVYIKQTQEVIETAQPISNADAWKTQQLNFDDANVEEVVQAVERYFNVQIELEIKNAESCTFTTTQPLDSPNLDNIFEQMEFLWGVQIEKQDSTYIIRGEGCKN